MKKLFALLLAMVMMLALVACNVPQDADTGDSTGDSGSQTTLASFTVVVVHSNGISKSFEYETDEEFVGPVLLEAGLIKGNDGQYGLEITEVDGEQAIYATNKAYWAIYEGEEYAMQGIDTTPVVNGRTYKLVYTGA